MEVIDIAKYSSHTIKAQTALKTSPMHFLFPDNVILETCLVRGGATVSDEDTLEPFCPAHHGGARRPQC